MLVRFVGLIFLCSALIGCTMEIDTVTNTTSNTTNRNNGDRPQTGQVTVSNVPAGEVARVTRVVDGDTINVTMNGQNYSVRYIGVNTPERDEACYQDAKNANAALVEGQEVTLVRDVSDTDQYDRLLRYVYVGNRFVNAELIANGWGERVVYNPDRGQADYFLQLETNAQQNGLGCHPTGIFNDGSTTR